MEENVPKVSQDVANYGSVSVKGYLNLKEATTVILATLGFATATDLIYGVAKALMENIDAWYYGPYSAWIVWVLGTIVSFFGARGIAKKLKDDGKPILFRKDGDDE